MTSVYESQIIVVCNKFAPISLTKLLSILLTVDGKRNKKNQDRINKIYSISTPIKCSLELKLLQTHFIVEMIMLYQMPSTILSFQHCLHTFDLIYSDRKPFVGNWGIMDFCHKRKCIKRDALEIRWARNA